MSDEPTRQNRQKVTTVETDTTLAQQADKTILNHTYLSMAAGLIPVPFLDFAGVSGVQLNMMRKLAQIYQIPFSQDIMKNIIGALLGGSFPASVMPRIAVSVSKAIPIAGQTLGVVSAAAVAGACTYAVGKVFNRHFAEGGTFLSFDPDVARKFYEEMFKEGQEIVAKAHNK